MHRTISLLAGVLPLVACAETPAATSEPVRDDAGVQVRDNAFDPDEVNIPAGAHVTWVWSGQNAHGIQFYGAASPSLAPRADGLYDRAFETAGVYVYYCPVHGGEQGLGVTGMSGRVVVY